jgi:hypothetical protein
MAKLPKINLTETRAEIEAGVKMRIAAILESPEGQRHPKSALKFAFYTDMSADMANDMLAGLPVESPFLTAMDREGVIGISAPLGAAMTNDPKEARKAELQKTAAAFGKARGYKG